MASATFNPACSGYVRDESTFAQFANWTTMVAGGYTLSASSAGDIRNYADKAGSGNNAYLDRGMMTFDTSSLGSGVTVTSATLALRCTQKGSNGPAPSLFLVSNGQASNTALASSDFTTLGSTDLSASTVGYGSFTVGVTYTYTLGSTGTINTTGYTKLGMRFSPLDLSTAPDLEYAFVIFDGTSGANPPVLTVNYTVPGSGAGPRRRPSGLYTR